MKGIVPCKSKITGNFFQISQEEFNNNDEMVGLNKDRNQMMVGKQLVQDRANKMECMEKLTIKKHAKKWVCHLWANV